MASIQQGPRPGDVQPAKTGGAKPAGGGASAPAVDPATLKAFKAAILRADAVDRAFKKLQPDFKARSAKLVTAAKEGDVPVMELMREQVATVVDKTEEQLHEIDDVLKSDVGVLRRDKVFAETRADQLAKLVGALSATRTALTKQFETAKQIDIVVDKALKAQDTSKEKAQRELADLERTVAVQLKDLRAMQDLAAELADRALLSFSNHDEAVLESTRATIQKLGISGKQGAADELDAAVDAFLKRWRDKGFGPDVDAEFAREAEAMRKNIARIRPWLSNSKAALESLARFQVGTADSKKALKVLGLAPEIESELVKALRLTYSAMEKALETIVKNPKAKAKNKATGKAMLADLKKGGVF